MWESQNTRIQNGTQIHKEGNPGWPIMRSVNYHTSDIWQYIDHQLQLHVKELKCNAKDPLDFIRKSNNIEDS